MKLTVSTYNSIQDINKSSWQKLCPPDFPFWDYEFLLALEKGACLGSNTGWHPMYLLATNEQAVLGALPLYIKTNSYGEYIFDWQWANAYLESGIAYYPKIVSAVPFTPANGPKILLAAKADAALTSRSLIQAAIKLMASQNCSSIHSLFVSKSEAPYWQDAGFKIRSSYQYHWFNDGYSEFDDFLSQLKGKRRRQIQRERQELRQAGLKFEVLTGDRLSKEHGKDFYQFYLQTHEKKYGIPYLTENFFTQAMTQMGDRSLLVLAKDSFDETIAASLSFFKGKVIYGRYWGCKKNFPFLHFELCYYQLIEQAITMACQRVEAGAQGEHKIPRGFRPTQMLSAHYIAHPWFKQAIERYIDEEALIVSEQMKEDSQLLPFRK